MAWITADIVFDGFGFHSSYYIEIDSQARILSLQNTKPEDKVEHYTGLLMPGMVNAHCHLELSYLKNTIPEKTGIATFLKLVREQFDHQPNLSRIIKTIDAANQEMQANGIIAVGDICNTTNTLATKKSSAIYYHSFVECIAMREADVPVRFEQYYEVYKQFVDANLNTSLSLHTPYTCHKSLYTLVCEHSNFITIHNQESDAENQFFQLRESKFDSFYQYFGVDKSEIINDKTPRSSFEHSTRLLDSRVKKLFVHNTFTSPKDLQLTDEHTWFCFCPNANLYIENVVPQIGLFLEDFSDKIVLGTDSLASNAALNILSEVKTLQDNFPEVPLQSLLKGATINGAKLFGIDADFGSFQLGKRPAFINVHDFDTKLLKLVSDKSELIA